MLVQAEAFDCWKTSKRSNDYAQYFSEWHEKDIVNLARHFRNHPSIVMWSHGNEVSEMDTACGVEIGMRLKAVSNKEDPIRPVTYGSSIPSAGFNGY